MGDAPEVIAMMLGLAVAVGLGWTLVAVGHAFAERLQAKWKRALRPTSDVARIEGRIAELEERVDFAERLLARSREGEPGALPRREEGR